MLTFSSSPDFSLSEHEDEVENDEDDDDKKRKKPKKKIKTFKKPATTDGAPKVKKPYVKRVVEPGWSLLKSCEFSLRMNVSNQRKTSSARFRQFWRFELP